MSALAWMCMGIMALAPTPVAPPQADGPSLVILPLDAKGGITRDTADQVGNHLLAYIRKAHVFARIVSTRELEAALGLEQQKQLLTCTADSCMAEIAGALNVTHILTGAVGRLGESQLFSARLIAARTGVALASVSQRLGGKEEQLLDAVPGLVSELLGQAGLLGGQQASATPGAAPDGTTTAAATGTAAEDTPPSRRLPLLGTAAGIGGAAVVAAVLGGLAVAAGVAVRLLVPTLPGAGRWVMLYVPAWVGLAGVGGLLAVLAPVALAGAVAVAVAGGLSG